MNPKVVQKLMGHSNINITLNIYTHVMESRMEEEITKFGTAKSMPSENLVLSFDTRKIITAKSHC